MEIETYTHRSDYRRAGKSGNFHGIVTKSELRKIKPSKNKIQQAFISKKNSTANGKSVKNTALPFGQ